MIKSSEPLSLVEVRELLKKIPENEKSKALAGYLKKFIKLTETEAQKLKKELQELNLIKIKQEHIIKIMDTMPEDSEDLRKIFVDVFLDENEITKILEIVKKYR
jgi:DNA-directed RNA polymerase subunit F